MKFKHPRNKGYKGDTMVEVLIAIAVAGFAIGLTYAISDRSLQKAISARERNESVNIVQSQIAALKLRYAYKIPDFNSDDVNLGFVVRSSFNPTFTPGNAGPKTDYHFCLNEQSASPSDSFPWKRLENTNFNGNDAAASNISTTNGYRAECIKQVNGTDYFVDMSAMVTSSSNNNTPHYEKTVYKVAVRWNRANSSSIGQTVIYYRL